MEIQQLEPRLEDTARGICKRPKSLKSMFKASS